MRLRVLDLDGAVVAQHAFLRRYRPMVANASHWGRNLRIVCRHGAFRRFEQALSELVGDPVDTEPALTLAGSGDFHHVSLALLRRVSEPFNLLVVDKHPDWVRGVPMLHCGTWLWHALQLPNLRRVFHVGGDLDFDNHYRWLAPWRGLRSGRVTVVPARRRYQRGQWSRLPHRALVEPGGPASIGEALDEALGAHRIELARWPLYISLDKDVMAPADAVVNWDSGTLSLGQVLDILGWFRAASRFRLAGADVVGDWSPVRLRRGLRTLCHWIEHPRQTVDPESAAWLNGCVNEAIVEHLLELASSPAAPVLCRPALRVERTAA